MDHKLCFIGTEITPSKGSTFVGGHVNTVVGLCKGLSSNGWEIHIITTPSRFLAEPIRDFPWAKIHLIQVGDNYGSMKYNIDFLFKSVKMAEDLHQINNFDLIHTHSGYFGPSIISVVLKEKLKVPAFFSLYCPASLLPTKTPLENYGIKLLSNRIDKIVAVTNNVKKSLLDFGVNETKIEVINSCIDEKFFNIAKQKISHSSLRTILFIGNTDKTKGLDIFLEAAEYILAKIQNIKFIITLHESDDILKKIKNVVSQKLGNSVEIMGIVENIDELILKANIVVVPFRNTEGISDIPLVVLEAMAEGRPVIASKLEGIKEVIQDRKNGILVDPSRPDELADEIIVLLNNSNLCDKLGEQAALSAKQFSYSVISHEMSNLYFKILGENI